MPSNLARPVIDLEGVGPAVAAALGQFDLERVGDLLRVPSEAVHAAASSLASPQQARSWRQMAGFLEIPAMTPQWAEALVWRDIYTHADLARANYAELLAHFAAAQTAKRIPSIPDPPALAAIMAGAAVLAHTGAITGNVIDQAKKPVAGAEIRIGQKHTLADDRGRFRISGLPLRQKLLCVANHSSAGSARLVLEAAKTEVAVVHQLTLKPGSVPYRRSQLQGERLPKDLDYPIKVTEVPLAAIAERDLLKVILFYADGKNAKLTSKLLDFEDGAIHIHWTKAPLSALPKGLKLHDHLIKRASGWQKVKLNRLGLRSYKRMLRVQTKFRGEAVPTALGKKKKFYDEALAEMIKAKAL